MDFYDYCTLIRIADKVEAVAAYEVPAGVIMATAVKLEKISYDGLEGIEISYVVVCDGNPKRIAVDTWDEAEAHRVYADEIDAARKVQAERIMWRR